MPHDIPILFAASGGEATQILVQLFYLVLAGHIGGFLARQARIPSVIGQVLAGLAVGPGLIECVAPTPFNLAIAEVGAVFLMFLVGMETKFEQMLRVGREALLVGMLGIVLPLAGGFITGYAKGYPNLESLFLGVAMVATSVGITAKVLQEMGLLEERFAKVILGAAVIDDVLGLSLLGIASGMAESGSLSLGKALGSLALSVGFVIVALFVGLRLVRRHYDRLRRIPFSDSFGVTVIAGLGLAALAGVAGLAPIIGAFLAGMVLAEIKHEHDFEEKIHAVESFLAPVFFAMVGVQLDWHSLTQGSTWIGGLILTVVAVVGKFLGGMAGALSLGKREACLVGVGMVPRGEVGLIVAGIGVAFGVIAPPLYSQVVLMVLLTTLLAPLALRAMRPRG